MMTLLVLGGLNVKCLEQCLTQTKCSILLLVLLGLLVNPVSKTLGTFQFQGD